MKDTVRDFPIAFRDILEETNNIKFDQLSDSLLGSL